MRLPVYTHYQESNIEGLGPLPSHWKVSRLGYEAWVRARLGWKGLKAEEYVDDGFAFLSTPNIKGRQIDFTNVNCITQARYDESPEIKLARKDVLLAKDGSTLGTVNVVRHLRRPATVNSSIAVITPRGKLDGIFLYYLFQSEFLQNTIQSLKGGMGVPHLFQEDLNKFRIPLPPLCEQFAIGFFLDRETEKIDALIAEQEKLITLLAEKREATISHAVTRGLNRDVPMQESGVVWLGKVPAHWTLPPLYMRYSSELGKMLDASRITGRHLVPYLRNVDVQWDAISYTDLPVMDIQTNEYERYTVRDGDLLVCEGGEIGRAAVVQNPVDLIGFQKALHRLRAISSEEYPRYMFYIFAWASKAGAFAGEGQSTIAHLTGEQLRKYRFPCPPLAEQQLIAHFLDAELAKLGLLAAEANRAVSLLKERRSALIAAAVTGQIDVRDAMAIRSEQTEAMAA